MSRGHTTHRVGDPLPVILLLSDLARLLGLSVSRVWRLEQDGQFAHFELTPRIGNARRYCGRKVQAWLDGVAEPEPARATLRSSVRKEFVK